MSFPTSTLVIAPKTKDVGIAYLLWFFLGGLGIHQFWLGKPGRGVLYLLTLGLLSIGLWVDLFTLPRQVRAVNARRLAEAQGQLVVAHRAQLAAESAFTTQPTAPAFPELTDGAS